MCVRRINVRPDAHFNHKNAEGLSTNLYFTIDCKSYQHSNLAACSVIQKPYCNKHHDICPNFLPPYCLVCTAAGDCDGRTCSW